LHDLLLELTHLEDTPYHFTEYMGRTNSYRFQPVIKLTLGKNVTSILAAGAERDEARLMQ